MARRRLLVFVVLTGAFAVQPQSHKRGHEHAHARRHSRNSENSSLTATLERMNYFAPVTHPMPANKPGQKYLLFSPDAGGPNNIRIGWEYSAVMALETARVFVLPPAESLYLLDNGPMHNYSPKKRTKTAVEDLIDLQQLKGNLPTLTWNEFQDVEGPITWRELVQQAKKIDNPEQNECKLSSYQSVEAKFLYMQGRPDNDGKPERREGFDCGEWWLRGGPKIDREKYSGRDWSLLTHGFVWHPDAFKIAAAAVNYLGLFNFNALHARYNDFQEHQTQSSPRNIVKNWGRLFQEAPTLYIASDEPERFRQLKLDGVKLTTFDELFNAPNAPLKSTKREFSAERWFKMTGPAEELICTYAKAFVGTGRSIFTGHIQRMRLHAQAPVTEFLLHNGLHAPNERPQPVSIPWDTIAAQLDSWKSKDHIIREHPKDGDMFSLSSLS